MYFPFCLVLFVDLFVSVLLTSYVIFCTSPIRSQMKPSLNAQHVQQISVLSIAGITVEIVVIFSATSAPREELL
jgi:hypothetical protein